MQSSLYIRQDRKRRDVFAGFIIDSSGSTANNLVLFREQQASFALTSDIEKIGDDYLAYAFSGECLYSVKKPNEIYSSAVREKIAALESDGGTPLARVVRHVYSKMARINSSTKILMVLSDGLPDSVKNAKQAFKESRLNGIHTYLLAVKGISKKDAENIAGTGNYIIFESAEVLSTRLPALYRRLTA